MSAGGVEQRVDNALRGGADLGVREWVWAQDTPTPEAKFVLVVAALGADACGVAGAGFKEVVFKITGLDDNVIEEALETLDEIGHLKPIEVDGEWWAVLAPKCIDRSDLFVNAPRNKYPPRVETFARDLPTSIAGSVLQ